MGRYRYLITDAAPDSKWLDEQWNSGASSHVRAAELIVIAFEGCEDQKIWRSVRSF
jgi:hypothetical protein